MITPAPDFARKIFGKIFPAHKGWGLLNSHSELDSESINADRTMTPIAMIQRIKPSPKPSP